MMVQQLFLVKLDVFFLNIFLDIYNNNGMQQGYSRNGIPPTAQMNAPSLMGPNAGLPDFRMPPPLFSE